MNNIALLLLLCVFINVQTVFSCDNQFVEKCVQNNYQLVQDKIEAWNASDGEGRWRLSDYYIDMLLKCPETFLSLLSRNETVALEWLEEVASLSFTWYKVGPSPLEKKRKKLLDRLKNISVNNGKEAELLSKIIYKINSVAVRTIE